MKMLEDLSPTLANALRLGITNPSRSQRVTARVWLAQRMLDKDGDYIQGQMVHHLSMEWTLAKVSLVMDRLIAKSTEYKCLCLPKSAFFPAGCTHVRRGDGFKVGCSHCDVCLRCNRVCKRHGLPKILSCCCTPAGLTGLEWQH